VVEKFGVPPEKMIDLQSLAGDSVDNVPGVPGIGVEDRRAAAGGIRRSGNAAENAESEIKQTKRRENLIEFADQARMSKQLVTLKPMCRSISGPTLVKRTEDGRTAHRVPESHGVHHADAARRRSQDRHEAKAADVESARRRTARF
jgi:5'-3' exonuclease